MSIHQISEQEGFYYNRNVGDFRLFDYAHGRCHLFVQAIQDYLSSLNIPSRMIAFMEFDDPDVDLICLDHVFLEIDFCNKKIYLDANGINSFEEIKEFYTSNSYESVVFEEGFFLDWLKENTKKNYVPNFESEEYSNLISFFEELSVVNIIERESVMNFEFS